MLRGASGKAKLHVFDLAIQNHLHGIAGFFPGQASAGTLSAPQSADIFREGMFCHSNLATRRSQHGGTRACQGRDIYKSVPAGTGAVCRHQIQQCGVVNALEMASWGAHLRVREQVSLAFQRQGRGKQ